MGNGVTVKNTASVSQRDVVDSLTKQLAKANERVALLERVEKIFNESPELTFENVKVMFNDELNKFAIEKQLETAKKCAFGSTSWVVEHIEFVEEQLRKEQDHEKTKS